jgi:PilZ domain-containing protein
MGNERRKNLRLSMSLDVVLNHRAQSVICTVRDISLGGAFVDAEPELLPYAGAVELAFSIPSDEGTLRLPASIRRVTDKGAALSFDEMGQQTYFQLVDLITVPDAEQRSAR